MAHATDFFPGSKTDELANARDDLAAAFRIAARLGFHEGTCNHFSLLLPGSRETYLINPFGLSFEEIRPADLLLVDSAGSVIDGVGRVEKTALNIHSRVHRASPDAACVLHTHMPYATALTTLDGFRLEMCHQNSLRFFDRIAYDRDHSEYGGLALSEQEGDRIAAALSSRRVLMLEHHGVIVTGPSIAAALDDLYYLERAAQVQILAMSSGRPLKRVSDELARRTSREFARDRDEYARLHFRSLKRLLESAQPHWRD
ncbi:MULTISPECIES: aldolase [unclassified Burkholderia]|uniref:aldolase n=1 Tax=unclassified Burkholderia TaxID=2613784 RepID=UPI000F5A1769|nr:MULTISPECIES: aldolase [unclassified Burkholderia]RQR91199.1 aldolase [Burkholderia sp. Bp8994]RQS20513.1 aldolase [Burkholderia sp. Bp8995]RQS32790.1 aldolase [Burkholderia sp. Bp8990]RQS40278.1 aldolase [Burkholderia sp. Bp8989]RQS52889.1 aldolase [Burkholderia sp. Bp8984]